MSERIVIEGLLLMADFQAGHEEARVHPSIGLPVRCRFRPDQAERIRTLLQQRVRVAGTTSRRASMDPVTEIDQIDSIDPIEAPPLRGFAGVDFFDHPSLEDLAASQGVSLRKSWEEIYGAGKDLWESEEEFEGMLAWLEDSRR